MAAEDYEVEASRATLFLILPFYLFIYLFILINWTLVPDTLPIWSALPLNTVISSVFVSLFFFSQGSQHCPSCYPSWRKNSFIYSFSFIAMADERVNLSSVSALKWYVEIWLHRFCICNMPSIVYVWTIYLRRYFLRNYIK